MARQKSAKTKQKEKLGTGEGIDYKPYINTSEFNSTGTTSVIVDWKTGRGVHCLSQAEAEWYYILRWDDNNVDIREQYPLDMDKIKSICEEFGLRCPQSRGYAMTTDFLVTEKGEKLHAYSIKTNKNSLSNRTKELLFIEKYYWLSEGIEYTLLFKEDVNKTLYNNIRTVVEYYLPDYVHDEISYIKHIIANKEIDIDLSKEVLTVDKYKELNIPGGSYEQYRIKMLQHNNGYFS